MKILKSLFLILACCNIGFSCKTCDNPADDIQDLYPAYVKKIFPYSGDETLRFLRNRADTIYFKREGITTTYTRSRLNEEGCERYERLEHKKISFHSVESAQHFGYENYILSRTYSIFSKVTLFYNNNEIGTYDESLFATSPYPFISDSVLGTRYDSVRFITHDLGKLTFKPGFGIIKFNINKDQYELIHN